MNITKNKKKASGIIDKIQTYSNDDETKKTVKEMESIIKEEFAE